MVEALKVLRDNLKQAIKVAGTRSAVKVGGGGLSGVGASGGLRTRIMEGGAMARA
jgi:hypothetical protein